MIKTRVFEPWFEDRVTPLHRRAKMMLAVVIGGAAVLAGCFNLL